MTEAVEKLDASLEARLARANALVAALEQGDEDEADRVLDEIGRVRQSMLFQEIGRLTRQLHDALTGFMLDDRLADLTEREMPDARERLKYVITLTEQAANTTLNVVEQVLPMVDDLSARTSSLSQRWRRLLQREMSFEEFREFSRDISTFLDELDSGLSQVQGQLNEVLMAQSFQDLTGQIIRRVIDLVQEVENSLVELIRFAARQGGGQAVKTEKKAEQADKKIEAQGPVVPEVDQSGAVTSQDEVDDLLSSLGF
ncbi:chemotaxis protein CheZ [Methylomarinovum caldicuralii]|uniref:Protein phosphatase CheZ n=1 Tax=Methylomarinovum caldicuralii TaxID=438856 RepID=A0AAU9C374_9GAMM|nr:protein phosphatase CheZ [Methylomarinovum caldicuralii]BCX81594.1 chemotaxis protein CheZ [Methylomarinovum caldicuralii]